MTKEEARNKLKKLGYTVVDDNSVVTVLIAPGTSMKNTIKTIKDLLDDWGYSASFAIRQHKGADDFVKTSEDDSEDIDMSDENMENLDIVDGDDVITDSVRANKGESMEDSTSGDEDEPIKATRKNKSKTTSKKKTASDEPVFMTKDTSGDLGEDEYYDDEDSDMLLTEDSIQFSLEDFGLDF